MVCSPLFGLLANKLGRIRFIALFLSFVFCAGNLLYANLSLLPRELGGMDQARVIFMIIARVIVGIGTSEFPYKIRSF